MGNISSYSKKFTDGTSLRVDVNISEDNLDVSISPKDASGHQITVAEEISDEMKREWAKIYPAVKNEPGLKLFTTGTMQSLRLSESHLTDIGFKITGDSKNVAQNVDESLQQLGMGKEDKQRVVFQKVDTQMHTLLAGSSLTFEQQLTLLDGLRKEVQGKIPSAA